MTPRTPQPTPARIAPIATLPAFHKLEGRKVVVAGGSEGALWKAELLSAAGAEVLVLAGDSADLFAALAASPVAGPVTVEPRVWTPADLTGAALAFADLSDHAEALAFVETNGVPVNPLHAQGYPSIGCEPCTRAVAPGEPERAGRWWWESDESKECGLHIGTDGKLVRTKIAA